MRESRYLWTVRYRRDDWYYAQVRYWRRREAAERFIDKLLGGERPDLSPIVECVLERQVLAPAIIEWEL